MKNVFFFLILCVCGCKTLPNKNNSNFHPLKFVPGIENKFVTTAGHYTIRLIGPDNPQNPTSWEGPIEIYNLETNKECSSENIPLVEFVYSASNADHLILIGFSGSESYIQSIKLKTCEEKWPQLAVYTPEITIKNNILTIQPGCECAEPPSPCSCSAAQILQLSLSDAPVLLRKESLKLTKKVLGVEFEGHKNVLNPKTPTAKIVN